MMEGSRVSDQEFEFINQLTGPQSRRQLLKRAGAAGLSLPVLASMLEGCGPGNTSTSSADLKGPIALDTLKSKAKGEGQLQAIGIPPEWADYKDILAGYSKNYSIPVAYQAEAEYSSAQELEVFKNSVHHPHGDIGDVGFAFGPQAIQQGLITPYKHAQWNDIPDELKDPDGYWCTEYWGTQAFVVNTDKVADVPTSFKDLTNPAYKNMIGIDGDPRQATDAFLAVYSAALAVSGSLDDITPGIEFFKNLKQIGNFTAARSDIAHVTTGEVAIGVMWDYLGLGFRDQLAGKPNLKVVIPSDGSIAGPYVSIINKTAPHPYAARLWNEYIFSDEGQLFYLTGYAHPARYSALSAAGKIPAELAAKLPPSEQYANVKFVTNQDQQTKATQVINDKWPEVLGQ
jgi:putative spermidine/putrescine transport system substrate-binding protein